MPARTLLLLLAAAAVALYFWSRRKPPVPVVMIAGRPTPQPYTAVGYAVGSAVSGGSKPSADAIYSRLGNSTPLQSSTYQPSPNPNWSNYTDVESSKPSAFTQGYYLQNSEDISAAEMEANSPYEVP